ncbi:MAG: EpsI family protein [Gemmataceae bacterium]
MFRALPTAIAFAVVVLSGVLSGIWTNRWSTSNGATAAAERLSHVPASAGDWDGEDRPVPPKEVQIAQADGILRRDYVHRKTGMRLAVSVVCGRPGPVSLHTPDVCFPGAGFAQVGAATGATVSTTDRPARFRALRFQKPDAVPTNLRVMYGWSNGGDWDAPEDARIAYARSPVLFKLYVVRVVAPDDRADADALTDDLIRSLLPQLKVALVPPAA